MHSTRSQSGAHRVEWVDYARGIGIFSVVALHILAGLVNAEIITGPALVDLSHSWAYYSFNMPVFFFLSGLFIMRSVRKPLRDFTADRLRTTAYPYFLWSVISVLVVSVVGSQTDSSITLSPETFGRMFYDPLLHYWFLYALFFIVMIVAVASKVGVSRYWLFLGAVLLFFWGFPAEQILAQHLVIYFAVGMVVSEPLRAWVNRTPVLPLLVISAAGLGLWGVMVAQGVESVAFGPHYAVQAVGFVGVIALCAVLEKGRIARFVWRMGQLSLEIYLVHVILGAGARWALLHVGVDDPALHLAAGLVAGVYGSMLLAWLLDRLHFPFAYRWPRPSVMQTLWPRRSARRSTRAA